MNISLDKHNLGEYILGRTYFGTNIFLDLHSFGQTQKLGQIQKCMTVIYFVQSNNVSPKKFDQRRGRGRGQRQRQDDDEELHKIYQNV